MGACRSRFYTTSGTPPSEVQQLKNTNKIVLLAAFLTTAVAFLNAQANSQEKAQEEPRKEVAQGARGLPETFKVPVEAVSKFIETPETLRGVADKKLKEISSEADKDKYQTWAAIVALIGALVSLLPKTLESVSLVSRRRKDLQRIEDLATLIQKIQAENVLSETTVEHVKIQIEAEIMLAVNGLEKGRRRLIEKKAQHDDLDLSFQRRLFLLYRPVGIRAWIAHFCAFAMAILGLFEGPRHCVAVWDEGVVGVEALERDASDSATCSLGNGIIGPSRRYAVV
jgi:hypothetical protein